MAEHEFLLRVRYSQPDDGFRIACAFDTDDEQTQRQCALSQITEAIPGVLADEDGRNEAASLVECVEVLAPVLQEETGHERGLLGRHVAAKSAEVDAWPDERKPAYVREAQEETGTRESELSDRMSAWSAILVHADEALSEVAEIVKLWPSDGEDEVSAAAGRVSEARRIITTVTGELAAALPSGDGERLGRARLAERFRDWIHETPLSLCNAGADECPDWRLAYELADLALAPAPPSGETGGPADPASVVDLFIERLTVQSPSFWHTSEMSSAPERLWNTEGESHWLDGRDATINRAREDFEGELAAARADVLETVATAAPPAGEASNGR